MRVVLLFPICALLVSCVAVRPKTENKAVAVAKEKTRESSVSGMVISKDGIVDAPLKFAALGLYNANDKLVAKAKTDATGKYRMTAKLPNGLYRLKLISGKHVGSTVVPVNGYKISNADLIAVTNTATNNSGTNK
ncbi:MAG: carboxypeptidase-like regulatory domain-containing protein [Bdellovibrionota bacterium]